MLYFDKQDQFMLNIDESQSVNEQEQNEFLSDCILYENCPHCERKFFQGKLAYHLKLCNSKSPMYKTPLKSTRQTVKRQSYTQNQFNNDINGNTNNIYEKCEHCKTKLPGFLFQKHQIKCKSQLTSRQTIKSFNSEIHSNLQTNSQMYITRQQLPKIKPISLKTKTKIIEFPRHTVRIRDELRCFRMAQQVQKIQCPFCGRKFSHQASLRHIPICQNVKLNERKRVVKRKRVSLGKKYYESFGKGIRLQQIEGWRQKKQKIDIVSQDVTVNLLMDQ